MTYIRQKTMIALLDAEVPFEEWPEYINKAVVEKIAREKKK